MRRNSHSSAASVPRQLFTGILDLEIWNLEYSTKAMCSSRFPCYATTVRVSYLTAGGLGYLRKSPGNKAEFLCLAAITIGVRGNLMDEDIALAV
jgi:hypothetical protein